MLFNRHMFVLIAHNVDTGNETVWETASTPGRAAQQLAAYQDNRNAGITYRTAFAQISEIGEDEN